MEKVLLTKAQASMVENHRTNFVLLMNKRITKSCATYLDKIPVEDVVRAFIDGYEIVPDYQTGDWVMVKWLDVPVERIYRVVESNEEALFIESDVFGRDAAPFSIVRRASPEEIKTEQDRVLWQKLGRKVHDIKLGDVVFTTHGEIYRVNDELIQKTDAYEADVIGMLEGGLVIGIYPAGSFVKFGGVQQ